MRSAILIGLAALLAAGPALAQSQPASGPRDRVERERSERDAAGGERGKRSREERPRRRTRPSGGGQVVVVPPSELSSSGDRTRAGGPGVAPPTAPPAGFAALIGGDEAGLRRALGDPATTRNEGQGAMWTYRMESCALHVFLTRDQAGVLRVKGAASGPLRRGAPTPAVDACVGEAKRS